MSPKRLWDSIFEKGITKRKWFYLGVCFMARVLPKAIYWHNREDLEECWKMMLHNDLCSPQVSIPYLSPHPQLGIAQDVCDKGSWRKWGESIGEEGAISTTVSGSLLYPAITSEEVLPRKWGKGLYWSLLPNIYIDIQICRSWSSWTVEFVPILFHSRFEHSGSGCK